MPAKTSVAVVMSSPTVRHYTPTEWAKAAIELYRQHKADRIVGEISNGGEMVEATLRMVGASFFRLEIDGEVIRNAEIDVTEINLNDADFVLGIDFLGLQRVWISYGSQQLFLMRRF